MMEPDVVIINPPIISIDGDPFGDIPYMSTGIVYLAGYLNAHNIHVSVIDGFGLAPTRVYRIDDTLIATGLTEDEIVARLNGENVIGISIHSGMSHSFCLRLADKIRSRFPDAVLVAGGNHASAVYEEFIHGGFDYVCIGEGEQTFLDLIKYVCEGRGRLHDIPGLVYPGGANLPGRLEPDPDRLAFPYFEALPLQNYWDLGMSHAPIQGKYVVITTSRGCPYSCRFCTTPGILQRKWRARSAQNVVDEIEWSINRYGIEDVIIQDEIFCVSKERSRKIAREIILRGLNIRLHLPSGLKVEHLDDQTLVLLKKAGLQYMCLAPESGSPRVLKNMRKPMDFDKLLHTVSFSKKIGIHVGCFFILGFEDESKEDREQTRNLILKLTRAGMDELSLFIWTPLPGADAFSGETGWSRYEDLNWSPSWRANFRIFVGFRRNMYVVWFLVKLFYHPLSMLRSAWNVITGKYELKAEMAVRRLLKSYFRRFGTQGNTKIILFEK